MGDEDRNRGVPQNELHLSGKEKRQAHRQQEQEIGVSGQHQSGVETELGASRPPRGGLVQTGESDDDRYAREAPEGYSEQDLEGFDETDQDRGQRWSQNADDIGRQYDQSGFAEGGGGQQDRRGTNRQQGWSGETNAERREFQREYDQQIKDDGSMTREQKLQQGWQDPDDPGQIADEGLIDEDEEDSQGGAI